MDDNQIIDLYWARNEDAITETDRAYGRKLHSLAENILRSPQDAEESVSDTYMKTWQTIPPQHPLYFFAYLAKLCRNFSFGRLDWNNAEKRRAEVIALTQELENCIPDSRREDELEGKAIGQAINSFLGSLSLENRLLFLRRYWYCDTVAEIAQRYGLREGAVKTRLHRLRGQLKIHLEKEGIRV